MVLLIRRGAEGKGYAKVGRGTDNYEGLLRVERGF